MLLVILNFVMMLPLNQLNSITTGFLDPPNLHLKTKFMVLAALTYECFYNTSALLAAILVGILNFVLILPLNQLNINNFLDPNKLSFDTTLMVLATLEPDFQTYGCFLKMAAILVAILDFVMI